MVSVQTVGTIVLKSVKLAINLIIIILYRVGYSGQFLGVGGTWNLNEYKSPDVEIIASGVFVGFFIYTTVILVGFCFGSTEEKSSLTEIIMNFVGLIMYIAIGATAIHYWHGYLPEHKQTYEASERVAGLTLGSLCIVEGTMYLVDLILSFLHFAKGQF